MGHGGLALGREGRKTNVTEETDGSPEKPSTDMVDSRADHPGHGLRALAVPAYCRQDDEYAIRRAAHDSSGTGSSRPKNASTRRSPRISALGASAVATPRVVPTPAKPAQRDAAAGSAARVDSPDRFPIASRKPRTDVRRRCSATNIAPGANRASVPREIGSRENG